MTSLVSPDAERGGGKAWLVSGPACSHSLQVGLELRESMESYSMNFWLHWFLSIEHSISQTKELCAPTHPFLFITKRKYTESIEPTPVSVQPWSLKKSHQGPRVCIMYMVCMYVYIWYMKYDICIYEHIWHMMHVCQHKSSVFVSFLLFLLLINRISLCSPDWYGTCYTNQVGLTLRDPAASGS